MNKGVYNLIFAAWFVVFLVVAYVVGSHFWNRYMSPQVSASQVGAPVVKQQKQLSMQKSQTDHAKQNLSLTTPLSVSLNGRVYPIDFIDARDNHIIISTKKELGKFPDLEISVTMFNQHIGSFSNKSLHFTGKDFSDPQIQVSWMDPGKNLPNTEFITKNYDMTLQFAQEQDYRIPVQIKLETKEKVTINAIGKFMAKTSDLVLVDGKVDLNQDNTDTLLYVIKQFIKQVDGVPEVKDITNTSYSMSGPGEEEKPDPNPSRVYSSASINFNFESKQGKEVAEFQMVRTNKGWQVYHVVEPERLRSAVEPDMGLDTLFMFEYLGDQIVTKTFGKDNVESWERKGSSLQHLNPDPKRDQTQVASASYLVKLKDGSQRYVKVAASKHGTWQVDDIFDGSQVPQAHIKEPVESKHGSEIQQYMSAVRLEKSLKKQYPHLQARGFDISCGHSNLFTDCRISWNRLVNNEEKCEGTMYMYKRKDGNSPWQFVRKLAEDEKLDHRDGQVKKMDKPRKYSCWF